MINSLLLIGNNWFTNILRSFTFLLDQGIYYLVEIVYKVFYYLASASILDENIVRNVTTRIYTILAIVMVFVLAFNLLNYIIDPDKITDKKVGASTFVKDVIIALVIITVSPMLFTKLYALQSAVITSGVIENLVLGGNSSEGTLGSEDFKNNPGPYKTLTAYYVGHGADRMIASIYVAFLYPNDPNGFTAMDCGVEGKDDGTYKDYCTAYTKVKDGYGLSAFSGFTTNDKYNYTPFLTTVAGIVLFFFMLSFCLNLAKRVGKLAIIQLIAPIPVTLELLPNKKGLRKTWIDTLIKVYIEVFFYLLAMYVIIFFISIIPDTVARIAFDNDAPGALRLITTVLLIFGLLSFGKEAPQLLFDLLGIKSTGVIKDAALRGLKMAGSFTAGAAVGATSMARNATGMVKNIKSGSYGAAAGNALGMFTGGVSGVARGMYTNRAGGFKDLKANTTKAVNANLASQSKHSAQFGQYVSNISSASGGKNKAKEIFRPAGAPFVNAGKAVGKWATGDSYSAFNAELQSYGQYKNIFDATKIKTSGDERYMGYQKQLDQLLQGNGMTDFYDKSKAYMKSHPGSTLDDYLSSSDYIADFAGGAFVAGDIKNLNDAMNSREKAMKVGKKDDLVVAVAYAKALVDTNSDVAKIAKEAGIDINSINVSSSSTDADIVAAYDQLNSLNKAINNRTTNIKSQIAANEMREKNKGGSGGGKK